VLLRRSVHSHSLVTLVRSVPQLARSHAKWTLEAHEVTLEELLCSE